MTRETLNTLKKINTIEWRIRNSSLFKTESSNLSNITLSKCKRYSTEDISRNTYYPFPDTDNFCIEIPAGTDFNFIGRVNTADFNDPSSYYKEFRKRTYIAFSTFSRKNVSKYNSNPVMLYNILPDDIVHVFPLDSDTKTKAKCEENLTKLPSIWLTLNDLQAISFEMETYNQITCKTKRNRKTIRPSAVLAINEVDDKVLKISKSFKIGIIIVHPDSDACSYVGDALSDIFKLRECSAVMQKHYNGLSLDFLYYI